MAIKLKTKEEIDILREGGKRLAFILQEVGKKVAPGVSTEELNDLATKLAFEDGNKPSLLNYRPKGAKRPYPAAICISINDEVVHGIPNENPKIIKDGDLVKLDMCLTHKGLITDATITVPAGNIDKEAQKLMNITKDSLYAGIKAARGGKNIGDIGYAVERVAKANGFSIVEDLCGHGVGYGVHEDPYVPNYGEKGRGEKLKPGMILALEPMLNEGRKEVRLQKDGYTYKTADGKRSAHFEHTILITSGEPEILTKI
jgi:methionyl aminopeptidase